jgi:hypothetical protein
MRLPIVQEEMAEYSGPQTVDIDDTTFQTLVGKFGIHSFDWYFVSPSRIKFFDGEHWKYTSLCG